MGKKQPTKLTVVQENTALRERVRTLEDALRRSLARSGARAPARALSKPEDKRRAGASLAGDEEE